eukprot:s6247_g2.t1
MGRCRLPTRPTAVQLIPLPRPSDLCCQDSSACGGDAAPLIPLTAGTSGLSLRGCWKSLAFCQDGAMQVDNKADGSAARSFASTFRLVLPGQLSMRWRCYTIGAIDGLDLWPLTSWLLEVSGLLPGRGDAG